MVTSASQERVQESQFIRVHISIPMTREGRLYHRVRDVSDWERVQPNSGSRDEYWLRDLRERRSRLALAKLPRRYRTHICGEVWAEYLAASVGAELGLPVPDVEIVHYQGKSAALIWSFLSAGFDLREGSFLTNSSRRDQPLTLDEVIEHTAMHVGDEEAQAWVMNMVCFDMLIGNSDRHQDNWGILIPNNPDQPARLAPYYDNGSAFGSNLGVNKLRRNLENGWDVFDNGFRYEIGLKDACRPYLSELLAELRSRDNWFAGPVTRLSRLTNATIDRIVMPIPDEVISLEQREFAKRLLQHRRDLIETGESP